MKFLVLFAAVAAVALATPSVSTWTFEEVNQALQDPTTDPALIPALEQALNHMMLALYNGEQLSANPTASPAVDISSWTLSELSEALQNPETDPALVPYLEQALNEYMLALYSGQQLESIVVMTPVGLIPSEVPIAAEPAVTPELVSVGESVESPASSPLVQLIININAQAGGVDVSPVAAQSPVVETPEPVSVVEASPVSVVEAAPTPVVVVENAPEPVVVVEPIQNPIDVIAVAAPEQNPIDVIAVAAPESPIVTPVVVGGGIVV